MTKLTMSTVERMLTWAYKQALSSHGPIDGAIEPGRELPRPT